MEYPVYEPIPPKSDPNKTTIEISAFFDTLSISAIFMFISDSLCMSK